MSNNTRRQFLQKTTSLGAFSILAVSGLLKPNSSRAQWQSQDFSPADFDQTLRHLFNDAEIINSDQITLKIPKKAENGAAVPLTITSSLDNISKLYVLVEKNPVPLAAEFSLSPEVDVYVKARIKMAESCNVVVIAVSKDRLIKTSKPVEVTIGGCGG